MLRSQLQVFLVTVFSSVLLIRVGAAPNRDMLTEILRADLAQDKDVPHLLLQKFVSDLVAARENGEPVQPELAEMSGVREEVVRRHIPLSQRERKAGCRNFFWKTFTSC
ncbi:somatostatin-1A [Diretmus argenteus]